MTQSYEIKPEFPKPHYSTGNEQKDQSTLADQYDLYWISSGVHSKISGMSRDYTLANYSRNIYDEKFPKFIREQRKLCRILKTFMIIPEQKLARRYGAEYAKLAYEQSKNNFLDCEKVLLGELDDVVIMSRSLKGEVITAMLTHGRSMEDKQAYEQSIEGQTILSNLKKEKK